MTLAEALGHGLMVTLCGTGLLTLGICLYLGAKELLRRVRGERRVERSEFERKAGLGL